MYRYADKSLLRPGRKQATATKLYFCKPLKNSLEGCPSNEVSTAVTSASDEKWRPFNCFFQSGWAKDLSAPLLYYGTKIININKYCVSWLLLVILLSIHGSTMKLKNNFVRTFYTKFCKRLRYRNVSLIFFKIVLLDWSHLR